MFSIQHCSVAAIYVAGVCEIIVIAMRNHNQAIQVPSPKLPAAPATIGCRAFVMSRRSAGRE